MNYQDPLAEEEASAGRPRGGGGGVVEGEGAENENENENESENASSSKQPWYNRLVTSLTSHLPPSLSSPFCTPPPHPTAPTGGSKLLALARSLTLRTTFTLLPTLRRRVEYISDVGGVVQRLRRVRSRGNKAGGGAGGNENGGDEGGGGDDEHSLWESLLKETVCRVVVSVVAMVAMTIVVGVETAVIEGDKSTLKPEGEDGNAGGTDPTPGRKDSTRRDASGGDASAVEEEAVDILDDDVAQDVLRRTYSYFFGPGLQHFKENVDGIVCQKMNIGGGADGSDTEWDIQTNMAVTKESFVKVMWEIFDGVLNCEGEGGFNIVVEMVTGMENTLQDSSPSAQADPPSPLVLSILEETYDILESPAFDLALRSSVEKVWGCFVEKEIDREIFRGGEELESLQSQPESPPPLPLANIVTKLKSSAGDIFKDERRKSNTNGVGGGKIDIFGGNVYLEAINREESVGELIGTVLDTF